MRGNRKPVKMIKHHQLKSIDAIERLDEEIIRIVKTILSFSDEGSMKLFYYKSR